MLNLPMLNLPMLNVSINLQRKHTNAKHFQLQMKFCETSSNFGVGSIQQDFDSLWTFLMQKKRRKKGLIQNGRTGTPSREFDNWIK